MRVLSIFGVLTFLTGIAAPIDAQDRTPHDVRPWEVIELFRLGGLDASPEEEFTNQLLSLSLGPNDQLFILDHFLGHIQVFSALDGQYVRTISRAGQGPGEINEATALGWDEGSRLWVMEPFAHRFSVFDSTGSFLRTVPRTWATVPMRSGHVKFDGEGRLVELVIEAGRPYLRVLDPASGEVLEEYVQLPPPPIQTNVSTPLTELPEDVVEAIRRFGPGLVWDWTASGDVWFARKDEYRLVAMDAHGDTLDVVEVPARLREFSPQEEALVDQARRHLRADDRFLAPAQLQSIIGLPDGHLLVHRPEEMNEPGQTFDILAPGGGYLGEIELPMPVWPRSGFAVQNDRLFVVGRGDYDVPVVMALSLRREGVSIPEGAEMEDWRLIHSILASRK